MNCNQFERSKTIPIKKESSTEIIDLTESTSKPYTPIRITKSNSSIKPINSTNSIQTIQRRSSSSLTPLKEIQSKNETEKKPRKSGIMKIITKKETNPHDKRDHKIEQVLKEQRQSFERIARKRSSELQELLKLQKSND